MSLNLKIDNIFVDIVGDLPAKNKTELQRCLSFRPENYHFNPRYNSFIYDKNGNKIRRAWDGWKPQFWSNKKRTYFPTGLISIAIQYLKENNIPFSLQDHREKPQQNFSVLTSDDLEFYDYQDNAINLACNKGRGIIRAATGAGKTIIGAGIIARLKVAPFMFFVTSVDLLEQAKDSFQDILKFNGSKLEVGQIGGGIVDIRDVNVCTIQTAVRAFGNKWDNETKFDSDDNDDATPIEKYKDDIIDVIRSSKGAISDEIQHWRAKTCQIVARELKSSYYTFGLSATPYRDEGDDMLIQACFGKKIVDITASELIQKDYLVRPEIKIVHLKNRKSKFKQWQGIYKDRVTDCDQYNSMIANIANGYVDAGRLTLVLVQKIDHGKKLTDMIKGSIFLSGKNTKEQRKSALNNLKNRYLRCIVSSTIFDEGIDVKPLDCVILAGQGKCVSEDSLLFTSKGLLYFKELKDRLNLNLLPDHSIELSRTIKVDSIKGWTTASDFYNAGHNQGLKIELENGLTLNGTLSHRIRIIRNGKIRYCQLQHLLDSDRVMVKKGAMLFGNNLRIKKIKNQCRDSIKTKIPNKMSPLLAKLIGYCISEGDMTNDRDFTISNVFRGDHKYFKKFEKAFGIKFNRRKSKTKKGPSGEKNGWDYNCCRKDFVLFLRSLGIDKSKSSQKYIPQCIRISNYDCVTTFLRSFCDGEAHVCKQNGIEITLASKQIITELQLMFLNLGIYCNIKYKLVKNKEKKYYAWKLKIQNSCNLKLFDKHIGFDCLYKKKALKELCKLSYNTNKNIIPGIKDICCKIRSQSAVPKLTSEHGKVGSFITKLAPISKNNFEFTHESLSKFLKFYSDVKSHEYKYLHMINNSLYQFVPIKSIKKTDSVMYDLSTDAAHYIVNGIVSHNSKTRAMQRIGRITRKYTGPDGVKKTKATAVDFRIHDKYLLSHSVEREKMYRTESEYKIEHINDI